MSRREPPFIVGAAPPLFNRIRNQFIPDAIKRLLGLTAEMGTPQLAPELQMSVELFDHQEQFQTLLGGTLWGVFTTSLGAAVGFSGISAIVNPTGSGELCIVESCFADNVTGAARTDTLRLGRTALVTPTVVTLQSMDQRRIGTGPTQFFPPTSIRAETSNAGTFSGGLVFAQRVFAIGQSLELITQPIIVSPGFSLQALTNTVNETSLAHNWRGRTRPIQGTELVLQ